LKHDNSFKVLGDLNKMAKGKLLLENLVVLKYAPNTACVNLCNISQIRKSVPDFSVSLEKEKWYVKSESFKGKIGKPRNFYDGKARGIIGVYDKTNIEHLSIMVDDAIEAVNPHGSHGYD